MEKHLYGKDLIEIMRAGTDFSIVKKTLLENKQVKNNEEAEYLIDAFLQWIALVPVLGPRMSYVMLKTSVDDVFHSFIINTKFYQDFCEKYFGFFIHHHALLDEKITATISGGVEKTILALESYYGEDLHPALKEWRMQLDKDSYQISCLGECPEDDDVMRDTILGILPNGSFLVH